MDEVLTTRRIAPSWFPKKNKLYLLIFREEVVETIVTTIREAERIYYESNKNYKIIFHFTLDNFFIIIGKVFYL